MQTQISLPVTSDPQSFRLTPGKRFAGFSFLEMMIVLFLLGLLATFAAPRFITAIENTRDTEFRHLTRVLNLLRNESILGNKRFFIIFDPKEQKFHIELQRKEGGRIEVENPRILRPHSFAKNFHLENISLTVQAPSSRAQWILMETSIKKPVAIRIDSSGFVTPFMLFFSVGKKIWVIQSKDILGHLEMKELQDA